MRKETAKNQKRNGKKLRKETERKGLTRDMFCASIFLDNILFLKNTKYSVLKFCFDIEVAYDRDS